MKKVTLGGGDIQYLSAGEYDIVRGVYIETRPSNGKFDGFNHTLDTENGTVVLNGNGQLNAFFKRIKPGTTVEIKYEGKKEITQGKWKGQHAHSFEFFVDDDSAATEPAVTETPAEPAATAPTPGKKTRVF
jgi:hypothetical protein